MIDMELNPTTILIGEVAHVLIDEQVITDDGTIDYVQAGTMTLAGRSTKHDMLSLRFKCN